MIFKTYRVTFCRVDRQKVTYKNGVIQLKDCDPDYLNNYRGEPFTFTSMEELKQDLADHFSPGNVWVDIDYENMWVFLTQSSGNLRPIDQAFIDSVKAGKCCQWELTMGRDACDVEGLGKDQSFFDIPSTKKEVIRLGEEAHQRILTAWNNVWYDRGEEAPPLTNEVEDCILRAFDWDHTTVPEDIDDIEYALEPYTVDVFDDLAIAYAAFTDRSEASARAKVKYAKELAIYWRYENLDHMIDEILDNADVCYVDDTAGYDHLIIMYNY